MPTSTRWRPSRSAQGGEFRPQSRSGLSLYDLGQRLWRQYLERQFLRDSQLGFPGDIGLWNGGKGGTDNEKIGTFVHELGHNLGLFHGGSEFRKPKPNHLSIMNYLFQTTGILRNGQRVFDYQPFPLPRLREKR